MRAILSNYKKRMVRISRILNYFLGSALSNYLIANNESFSFNQLNKIDTGNDWDEYRVQIFEQFQKNPMNFLRQPTISRTVHPNEQELACSYLEEMRHNHFARQNILSRIHDRPIGNPFLCDFFPLISPITAQHAYYLFLIHKELGIFIPDSDLNIILEIGGGYGNFCRLIYDLGYAKKHIIVDLPEMHIIQKHFLQYSIPRILQSGLINFCEIKPNAEELTPRDKGKSLLIATFSLNEMPLKTREILETDFDKYKYFFFAYNKSFASVDNLRYFEDLKMRWSEKIDFITLKDQYRSAWFLIGTRK